MGFHIQLRLNLVKSRKQISKHQNQGYCRIGSFVRKIKEKNTSAELSGCRNVRVPNCLTQVPKCPSSNNKTLNARLLARVITGCHYT